MAGFSNYLKQQILTHNFRTGSWTKPTNLAIALCTTTPTATSTGSTIVEVTNSGSYARLSANPLDSNWTYTTGQVANAIELEFPVATGDWSGPIQSFAIVDSATYGSGNMLYYGTFSVPQTIVTTNQFVIPIGGLVVVFN